MADIYDFTVAGICNRVLARLGQTEEETNSESAAFDKCLVEATVNDVLSTISTFRPDLFVVEREVALLPGKCGQVIPKDCPRVQGYICVRSSNGDEIPVTLGNYTANLRNRSYPQVRLKCNQQPNDELLNIVDFKVGISPVNDRRINITPVPPSGFTYKLIVECIELNSFTQDVNQELPSEIRPWILPIVEMTLYAMISIDSADTTALARSQQHASLFASLSNLNLRGLQETLNVIADQTQASSPS